jgi:phage FluMu gp28-like protein
MEDIPSNSLPSNPQPTVPAGPAPVIPLLDYQRADVESPARFTWCCWSRQIGKSFTKSLRRLLRGLERRRTQVFLSAGERQSRELMLKAQQHCRALNIACSAVGDRFFAGTGFRQLTIELPNGVRIIGLPANPQTARGFTGDVFLDEFAMHREDREIWAAVFPTIMRGDGELDIASTPKGLDNLFAEQRSNPQFTRSTVTLQDAIAAGLRIDAEEIRRSMNDDELFRQEFGCEFLDETSAFLTYEQIQAAEDPRIEKGFDLAALAAGRGELYVGVDIGRHRDLTVMWVVEKTQKHQNAKTQKEDGLTDPQPFTRHGGDDVLITRGLRESVGEPFRDQWAVLHALLSMRSVRRCCIDAGGIGMPLAEAAVEAFGSGRVEAVTFTAGVKDEMASRLRMRVEEGTIRIPADESIRNDWHSVRRSVTSSGPAQYEADRRTGAHAHRVWAACLAVRAAGSGSGGAIEGLQAGRLLFSRAGIW